MLQNIVDERHDYLEALDERINKVFLRSLFQLPEGLAGGVLDFIGGEFSNWTLGCAKAGSGDFFDLGLGLFCIHHPTAIKVKGTSRYTFIAVSRVVNAGVAPVQQFEEMVL